MGEPYEPDPNDEYPYPPDTQYDNPTESESPMSENPTNEAAPVQAPEPVVLPDGLTTVRMTAGPGVTGCDFTIDVAFAFTGNPNDAHYGGQVTAALQKTFAGTFGKIAAISEAARNQVTGLPKGYVSVHETAGQAPVRTGVPVGVATAAGVQAVAAGAPVGNGSGWETYPNRFDQNEQYRTMTKEALDITTIEDFCQGWAVENELNPEAFILFDERNSQGKAISATANFKVKDDVAAALGNLVGTKKTVGRVHVNRDGSLKLAVDKHWATLLSTGILATTVLSIHGGGAAPAPAPAPVASAAPQAAAVPAPVQAPSQAEGDALWAGSF